MRMSFIGLPPFRYTFSIYVGALLHGRWRWGRLRKETAAVIVLGRFELHLTECHYSLIVACRNIRLARVDNTADSSGNRKPPRCIINRFLEAGGRRLSTSERRLDLKLFNLRFAQSLTRILPFNTFSTHSLILCNMSLLQLEKIALRNLGLAFFSTCSA